ncbi:hypothetical protein QBC46DRAFT_386190 [Diplogelasinospora grovesii]|uniref:Ubiquitin-like-conjugating enzyme ATG10 n=1 Tax=Diplogelasinospora grovesii TaxID=303347 RepID=A0AAN6N6F3_9PEZI|nr:hypothetical protein QBC46DRAFT_386190 [Diplogelasinospora grovesii]
MVHTLLHDHLFCPAPKMSRSSDFESYPFLTPEEFTEVCHNLDRRYCQATLGPLRRQWKLRVRSALNIIYGLGPENSTYIQIIRPLEPKPDDDELSSYLDRLSFEPSNPRDSGAVMEVEDADREMIESEEADQSNRIQPQRGATQDFGYVTYEIHLHPTYRAPCLWFTLHGLPPDEPPFNIDTVFRRLVPDQYKEPLRNAVGTIGGISIDHHPLTGVPSFFIHPCLLGEAMANFPRGSVTKEDYLMVWLGLVGGCVGLWVPKEMALLPSSPS